MAFLPVSVTVRVINLEWFREIFLIYARRKKVKKDSFYAL